MNLLDFITKINKTQPKIFIQENFKKFSDDENVKIIPNNYKIWKLSISKNQPIVCLYLYIDVIVIIPENKELNIESEQKCSYLLIIPIINKDNWIDEKMKYVFDNQIVNESINFNDIKNLNLSDIFDLVKEQNELKAENKVLKYLIDKESQINKKEITEISEYLKSYDIIDGNYRPKKFVSYNDTNSIEISIKGFSNLPLISDVLKRISENKSQTSGGTLLKTYIDKHFNGSFSLDSIRNENKQIDERLDEIDNLISYQCYLFSSRKLMPDDCSSELEYKQNDINIKFRI